MLDLRPNAAVAAGRAIVAGPTLPADPNVDDLTDRLDDPLPAAITTKLNTKLGVTLAGTTLREIIVELFEVWAGSGRWKPLVRQAKQSVADIWLGGEKIGEVIPPLAGGTVFTTESWTAADSASMTADQAWSEFIGNMFSIVSNKCRSTAGVNADSAWARCDTPIGSPNHIVSATLGTWSLLNYHSIHLLARMLENGTQTAYLLEANINETNYKLKKMIAGSFTDIQNPVSGFTLATGDRYALKVNGTNISVQLNNSTWQNFTDSSITTGYFGGLGAWAGNSTEWAEVDDWKIEGIPGTNYPRVKDIVLQSNSASTNHTMTYPASRYISAGDTLIGILRTAGAGAHTWPAGWNELFEDSSDGSDDVTSVAWKKADGTETGTFTVTGGNFKSAGVIMSIDGAQDPTIRAPEFATIVTGNSTTPDPGTVTPTGGTKDYLFIWIAGHETQPTAATPPTGYEDWWQANSAGGGAASSRCGILSGNKQTTASSENPPSVTISAADDWTATVLAIHPRPSMPFRDKHLMTPLLVR